MVKILHEGPLRGHLSTRLTTRLMRERQTASENNLLVSLEAGSSFPGITDAEQRETVAEVFC